MEIEKLISNKSRVFGRWWFGSARRQQYKGTLTFDDKITLDISGSRKIDLMQTKYSELRGISLDGEEFILLDNFVSKSSSSISGDKSSWTITLEPSDIILFSQPSDSKLRTTSLNHLQATIPYFDFWLNAQLFEHNIIEHTINYKDRDQKTFDIDGCKITFGTYLSGLYSWGANTRHSMDIRQSGYVSLDYPNEVGYKEAIEQYRKIESFFRLAYANQFFVKQFFASTLRKSKYKKHFKQPIIELKDIYQNRIIDKTIEPPRLVNQLFLFKFTTLENPEKVLNRWLEIEPSLTPVYQLLFSSLESGIYIEQRFLSLINAIEIFHRRFRQTVRMPEDKWELEKVGILEKWHGQYRNTIKRWLSFANDISLESRLKSLVTSVSNTGFRGLMPKTIKEISVTRNDFIHQDFGTMKHDINLIEINEALTEILFISILQELGLENDLIRPLTRNSDIFKYSNHM